MISVIMLTYNRAAFVRRMIDCVLAQSVREFEYVIVNNGSTDNTQEILEGYQHVDSRIRVIQLKEPVTIGTARNIGIKSANGKYIAFVDDDDSLTEDYLAYLSGLITEFHAQIAIAGTEEELDGSVRPQCMFPERECISGKQAVHELLQRKRIRAGTAAKLVLRTIWEKHLFPENCIHEDIHVTYRLLADAERVAMGGNPIYRYLRHGGNISFFTTDKARWTGEKLREYIKAYKEREVYIAERFPDLTDYVRYTTFSFEISMCRQLMDKPPEGTEELLRKMYRELQKGREQILMYSFLAEAERDYLDTMPERSGGDCDAE